ncbi:MAG: LytR/AlgR family response regulator transcription factor [Erysipelotrichaceae bacterium]
MLSVILIQNGNLESSDVHQHIKDVVDRKKIPVATHRNISSRQVEDLFRMGGDFSNTVFFYDMTTGLESYLSLKEQIFQNARSSSVVLVAEESVQLKDYLRLNYCPDCVIFKPVLLRDIEQVLTQVHQDRLSASSSGPSISFKLKSKGSILAIAQRDIVFFESRGKQIALKTRGQEFLFYSSFGEVQQKIGQTFIRCHKGFMINTEMIKKVNLGRMTITMIDESTIPLSRTYKENLKRWVERG